MTCKVCELCTCENMINCIMYLCARVWVRVQQHNCVELLLILVSWGCTDMNARKELAANFSTRRFSRWTEMKRTRAASRKLGKWRFFKKRLICSDEDHYSCFICTATSLYSNQQELLTVCTCIPCSIVAWERIVLAYENFPQKVHHRWTFIRKNHQSMVAAGM